MSIARWVGHMLGELAGSYNATKSATEAARVARAQRDGWGAQRDQREAPATVEHLDRMQSSDDAYAAVMLLAENAASVPLQVFDNGEPAPDSDLQLLLDRWNPEDGAEGALTRLYMYLFLTGECFTMV